MRWKRKAEAETQAEAEGEVMEDLVQYPDEVTLSYGRGDLNDIAIKAYREWFRKRLDDLIFEELMHEETIPKPKGK